MVEIEIPYPSSGLASGAHKYFQNTFNALPGSKITQSFSEKYMIDHNGTICFPSAAGILKQNNRPLENARNLFKESISRLVRGDHDHEVEHKIRIRGWMPFIGFSLAQESKFVNNSTLTIPLFHNHDRLHRDLKKFLNRSKRVIALTKGEADLLNLEVPIDVIPPYLSNPWFSGDGIPLAESKRGHLLWVGRADASKGVNELVSLANELHRKKIQIVAVGPKTDSLPFPITGLGIVSEETLISLYDSSVGLLHTGVEESFSYSIAQALARGKRSICRKENQVSKTMSPISHSIELYSDGGDVFDFYNSLSSAPDTTLVNFAKNEFSQTKFQERIFKSVKVLDNC
ncbi:MAG: hypothetical protein RL147_903 [Actinomycetota bacterium]|jgi:hypothetical protein